MIVIAFTVADRVVVLGIKKFVMNHRSLYLKPRRPQSNPRKDGDESHTLTLRHPCSAETANVIDRANRHEI